MEKYHGPRTATAAEAQHLELPEQVQLAIDDLAGKLREGLLALSVGVGLKVMDELLEEELVRLCGPKGKHDPERTARRHGSRRSSVVLGGRKVKASRPRARTTEGEEARLRTWKLFSSEDLLDERTVETMLAGLSTRRYRAALEPTGAEEDRSTSRSAASRRFVRRTRAALGELMGRPVPDDLVVLMLDGVSLADHTCVVALGIDSDGRKHPLGLFEGATESPKRPGAAASLREGLAETLTITRLGLSIEGGVGSDAALDERDRVDALDLARALAQRQALARR